MADRGPKIGDHPDIDKLEYDLVLGKTVRDVARKYGVSKSAVHRLKKRIPPHLRAAHLAEILAPGQDLDVLRHEESRGLIAVLSSQRAKLHLLQDRALAEGDTAMAVKIARAINANATTIGQFLGEFVQHTQSTSVSLILSPEYARLRNVITQVLRKYPEALSEFTERMKALELEQLGTAAAPVPLQIEAHANG